MSSQIHNDPRAPFSQEAEEALLGSILLNPRAFVQLNSFLDAETFFLLRHRYIWQALERINDRNEPIDHITLAEELAHMETLDQIGGRAYLIQLMNNTGTAMHAEVYGRLVQRTAIRRKLMAAANDIRELATNEDLNIESVIGEAENRLFDVTYQSTGDDEVVPLHQALSEYYDYMEYHFQRPDDAQGIPSGFRDVDQLLGGFKPGQLVIVAGRPGMGKTAWVLSAMANMARIGSRVAIFSLEMTIQDLVMRLMSLESGINLQRLSRIELTEQERARFTECVGRMADWPLYLYDKPRLTPGNLRLQANRVKHQYGLDAVIVDYAQLMEGDGYDRRTQQGDVSRRAKELAKELGIPVILLAQLNRNLESRKDKRPIMSDLKESGDFEQDADVIMFLYRDGVYNDSTEFPNQAEIIVSKQRNGPTGTVSMYFEKSLAKFTDSSVHRLDTSDLE